MESSHLVIFSTSGKFITKFNVLGCISLSETLFWTGPGVEYQSPLKKGKGLNFVRNASSRHTRVTELKVEQINFAGQWHFHRKCMYI